MQNVSENSLDLINQGCALMVQQQYEQALADNQSSLGFANLF